MEEGRVNGQDPLLLGDVCEEAGGDGEVWRVGEEEVVWMHVSAASFPVDVYKNTYADVESFFVPKDTRREVWAGMMGGGGGGGGGGLVPSVRLIKDMQKMPEAGEEKDVVRSVLVDVFQDIIFDPDIQDTIEGVERAPIPLFVQLCGGGGRGGGGGGEGGGGDGGKEDEMARVLGVKGVDELFEGVFEGVIGGIMREVGDGTFFPFAEPVEVYGVGDVAHE